MKPETKYKGAIKLAAIGDALGWITEFERNSDTLKSKYGTVYVSKFYDWEKKVGGKFNGYIDKLKKRSYSDDTQLMLSVARSIMGNGAIDREYFSKVELPSWILYARGAGRTIKNAARKSLLFASGLVSLVTAIMCFAGSQPAFLIKSATNI